MTYQLVRWSLATGIPYAELLAMSPELLATVMLAHHDLNRGANESPLADVDD